MNDVQHEAAGATVSALTSAHPPMWLARRWRCVTARAYMGTLSSVTVMGTLPLGMVGVDES